MCSWRHLTAVLCAAFLLGPAAADPPLERPSLAREPAYRQTPFYGLLVIGPEARGHWLVVDGESVYLDRNANGDLTEQEDRLTGTTRGLAPPNLKTADGDGGALPAGPQVKQAAIPPTLVALGRLHGTPFSNLFLQRRPSEGTNGVPVAILTDDPGTLPRPHRFPANGVRATLGTPLFRPPPDERRGGLLVRVAEGVLTPRPQDAPIMWFGGVLTLRLESAGPAFLQRGNDPSRLFVMVGTFATGNGSRVLTLQEIPPGLHPVATVEFPPGAGGKPVLAEFPLAERC